MLLAGAAGVAQILYNNYTVYNLGFRFGLNSFTAAVLGGIGNLQGAVLGALVIGEVNALSDFYLSPNWTQAIVFGVLIAHPRLQADRPARPAAGGSSMSGATETDRHRHRRLARLRRIDHRRRIPGQYRAELRRKRGEDARPDAPRDRVHPLPGHRPLRPRPVQPVDVFPLPYPDDTVATFMMIFAIMAIGLNIVAGFAGLLDLGYVAFYAIGAYCAAFLASPHFGSLGINLVFLGNVGPGAAGIHLPYWIIVIVAVAVVATFGALLGAPTLRLRGDYLAIVTLGFGEIVPLFFKNLSSVTFSLTIGPISIQLARTRTGPAASRASTRSIHRSSRSWAGSSTRARARWRSISGCSSWPSASSSRATSSDRGSAERGAPSARTRPRPR